MATKPKKKKARAHTYEPKLKSDKSFAELIKISVTPKKDKK